MYWHYLLIPFRMRRLHLSLLNVGHYCIIKRPSSFRNWVLICTRLLFRHFKSYNVYKFNKFTIVIDLNTIDYTMLFILTYLWYILSCYGSCLLIWLYLYYSTFCNSRVIFGLWHLVFASLIKVIDITKTWVMFIIDIWW